MIHAQDPVEGVVELDLSPEEEKKLVDGLMKSFDQALQDREDSGLDKQAQNAVLQYHSALDIEQKDPQGSHLDMASTRKLTEQAISRFMNPIFQRDQIVMGKPRFPQWVDFAKEAEGMADWMLDRTKLRLFLEPFLKQAFVFPKAVAKIPFKRKLRKVKRYIHEVEKAPGSITKSDKGLETRQGDDGKVYERHWGLRDKNDPKITAVEMEEVEAGSWPETVPWQDFIHPVPCSDVYTSSWVTHRTFPGPDDITRAIQAGVYRENATKADGESVPILKAMGDPTAKPDESMGISTAGVRGDGEEASDAGEDSGFFEILEFYTTHAGDEVIITIDRQSKTVLRAVENFYMEDQRPFVTWSYEATLNNVDGISLCFILEPYHRAISCLFNQALDSGSLALEKMTFIDANLEAGRYFPDNKGKGGVFTVNVAGKVSDSIAQFDLGTQIGSVQYLISSLQSEMRELASLTPYHSGIETIQRPTATGQVALIEEGKQPQYNRMDSLRTCLSALVMMMFGRYRQFNPVDFEYYVQSKDPKSRELSYAVIKWPAESWRRCVNIELAISSEQMNRDMRKQAMTALVDKMPQVFEQVMGLANMAMSPAPTAVIARQLLDFQLKNIIQPWLEEFEVLGREALDLGEAIDTGAAWQQQLMQMQQQMEMLGSEVQSKDAQLGEMARSLHHVFSQFVAATGKMPQPTPFGRSSSSGPPQAAAGMGGGSEVPGGADAALAG